MGEQACNLCNLKEDEEEFEFENILYCEECFYDRPACRWCDGTGEGRAGEFRCWKCKGSGEDRSVADNKYAEENSDYSRKR